MLVLHIAAGTVGLLSGAAAMIYRKGSDRHRRSGHVFVVSMLILAATGSFAGFRNAQPLNGLMGILTFYLVTSAWRTARNVDGDTSALDRVMLVVPLAVAATMAYLGVQSANSDTGTLGGFSASGYFVFGSLAAVFAAGDIRMLRRGGVTGAARIGRHLRRMCAGWFIATGSFFLGQQQVFPDWLRGSPVLIFLAVLPLLLMVFWLFRYKRSSWPRRVELS